MRSRVGPLPSPWWLVTLSLVLLMATVVVGVLPAAAQTRFPLTVTKEFTDDPVPPGGTATLRFTISNFATSETFTAIGFTDDFDATLTGLAVSGALPTLPPACGGASLSASAGNTLLTFSGGAVAPGASCAFDVTLAVPAMATPGAYPNSTSPVSAEFRGDPFTVPPATDTLDVRSPVADVMVSKSDGVTSAVPGAATTYTIVVGNAGPSPDPAVSVTDTFPAALTCTYTASATGGATGYTAAGAGNLADTVSMPSGSMVIYTVDCSIDPAATGTLSNTVMAVPSVFDPNLANNTDTDTTDLAPETDLSVTKTGAPPTVFPGATVTYTVEVTNNGPSTATGVVATDTLPAGVTLVSTSGCAEDPTGVPTCTLGTIAPGASKSYTITVTVDSTTVGLITNSVTATAATTDPDPTNNTATADTDVLQGVGVIVASVDPEPSDEGSPAVASATFTASGAGLSCMIDHGDGSPVAPGTIGPGTCTGPPHTYADNGIYTVTVTITGAGASSSDTVDHVVDNVAPTVAEPTTVPDLEPRSRRGQSNTNVPAATAAATFTDPGILDTHTCTVDYGDGTPAEIGSVAGSTCTGPRHVFPREGLYTVTVSVTDKDGGVGTNSMEHIAAICDDRLPTILGTPGADVLVGTAGDDVIHGIGGNDVISGGLGNDTLCGGTGVDDITGGQGNDVIFGGEGADTADGGPGNDTVNGNEGPDSLFGGPGDDVMSGGDNADTARGGAGNDRILGGAGGDRLYGDDGDDELIGATGRDTLRGGPGDDDLGGGDDEDRLFGEAGNDVLRGGPPSVAELLPGQVGDRNNGGDGTDRCVTGEVNTRC